jgi:F-type H+-transporting ATPase subunit gamma
VTSDGGLSGDIDYKIIERTLKEYNASTTDIVVIGGHGATQLASRGTPIAHYFKLPDVFDKSVDLGPIVALLNQYHQVSVFYETYVSLAIQDVARIDLQAAVKTLADQGKEKGETISSRDYVFEPSLAEVIEFMESTMIEVVLSQVILESRLAQFASRFNAMSTANEKAKDIKDELSLDFYRAKRGESDERLKEIVNGMKALV